MTAVEFRHVTKTFGSVTALDNIALSVRSGEFATVLGPSGSGKSTLLALLAGIVSPTSGEILVGGRDITGDPPARRNIGLVFQSYALFPHLSVFENVAFPLRVRRLSRSARQASVAEVLSLVRLTGLENRRPHELSGGQQQRVALARALVFKPDILLLDEPLAALDRKLRDEVRTEIRELQRKLGVTTIMVTHDQDEALSISDRLVILEGGRVQQIGTPDEAYHEPRSRFVAGFLGLANFFDGMLETDRGRSAIRLDSGALIPCMNADAARAVSTGKVCALIRPEDLRIANGSDAGASYGGTLEGTVRQSVFLGESVRYTIQTDDGLSLITQVAGSRRKLSEGARVRVSWDPERVWILP